MAALGLALAACSSIDVRTDYDPEALPAMDQYRTYAWLPLPEGDDPRVHNELMEARITSIVDETLAGRGFEKLTDGVPDFLVGYHVALQGRMSTTNVNTYYGYGWGPWYTAAYGNTYTRYYGRSTAPVPRISGISCSRRRSTGSSRSSHLSSAVTVTSRAGSAPARDGRMSTGGAV
jgi:hypothetical protein